jgi:hypothetical protein
MGASLGRTYTQIWLEYWASGLSGASSGASKECPYRFEEANRTARKPDAGRGRVAQYLLTGRRGSRKYPIGTEGVVSLPDNERAGALP